MRAVMTTDGGINIVPENEAQADFIREGLKSFVMMPLKDVGGFHIVASWGPYQKLMVEDKCSTCSVGCLSIIRSCRAPDYSSWRPRQDSSVMDIIVYDIKNIKTDAVVVTCFLRPVFSLDMGVIHQKDHLESISKHRRYILNLVEIEGDVQKIKKDMISDLYEFPG